MLSTEHINDFIETQLAQWPEAKQNFDRLVDIRRKPLELGALPAAAQLNPARIRSTAAAVDKESVARRACFLCAANRGPEQLSHEWPDAQWHLLLNPFPILPVHFTIVNRKHTPQANVPVEMALMAEQAPSLVIFYNGAKAGASAPDHLHCQAMLKTELPLMQLTEKYHPVERKGWMSSEEFGVDLPYHFLSAVVDGGEAGMRTLRQATQAFGIDAETGAEDTGLVNAYFWISDGGWLRIVIVPRRAHRPPHYFREEGERFMISPGAVDMAGLLIVPREEDYNRLTPQIAAEIYAATAFASGLPEHLIISN